MPELVGWFPRKIGHLDVLTKQIKIRHVFIVIGTFLQTYLENRQILTTIDFEIHEIGRP